MSINYYIIYFLSIIPMQIIFLYNYGNMTNQKRNINVKYFIYLIITSLLVLINNYFNYMYLRIFTGIILNIITCFLIYKDKFMKMLFNSIIHAVVIMILEILMCPILLFKIDNIYIFNESIFTKCFFSLLLAFISIFIFKNKKVLNFKDKLYTIILNNNISLIIIPIILIFINVLAVFRVIDFTNIFMLILSVTSVLFMVISLKIIINDKYNLKIINERNENLKESYKAYSETIEECREFKHNIKNEIYSIKSLLPLEHQEKINEIIKKYIINYEWIDKLDKIPEGLQGLIYLKKKEAEENKININICINGTIKFDKVDYLDLCGIIGILLDNAIEATTNAKKKCIELIINNKKSSLNIRIINNYKNNIDLMKIGKKNYSTKEYKSGLGLNYIKKLNNPKIKVSFKIINTLFITDISYI